MELIIADFSVKGIVVLLLIGLIAGALARFLIPGKQDIGIILTIILGIVGAFVGGFLQGVTKIGGTEFLWQVIFATAGAIVVLLVGMLIRKMLKKS